MLTVPAGSIVLRDEGTRAEWTVEIPSFRLAATSVTREFYHSIVDPGEGPTVAVQPRAPVTDVSWRDAVRFCNRLSQDEGLRPCYVLGTDAENPDSLDVTYDRAADGYRLPTEAEWEYASRAGSSTARYGELDEIAWYRGNSAAAVHDVAALTPNAWGFFDTLGNVWEWCWDHYDPRVYGPYRVFRGGGWNDPPRGCRASCRRKSHPSLRMDDLGFRIARSG